MSFVSRHRQRIRIPRPKRNPPADAAGRRIGSGRHLRERNGVTRSSIVTVQPPPVTIAALSIAPPSVVGTNTATGTVMLTDAAPANGVEVELRSSDPAVASVPSAISIVPGAASGTFVVTTSLTSVARTVTITAAHATTEKTVPLTIEPPVGNYVSSVSVTPPLITGGTSAAGTVTLAQ